MEIFNLWHYRKKNCSVPILLLFSHSVLSSSFATPWTIAHQTPLSMRFPRKEYWSGLPLPMAGDLPNSGIEPMSLASSVFWILYHYRHVRSPPALTALKKTFILICFGLISDPRSPFQEFTPALNRFSRSSSGPNTEGLYEYPCNCSMTSIFKAGILFFSWEIFLKIISN